MRAAGRKPATILRLWVAVTVVLTLATVAGYGIADNASDALLGGVNGFAAGALIVMLVDSMIPEAARQAGRPAGLITTLGFALAAGLSGLS
jgi:zinc transporter, ZIP family